MQKSFDFIKQIFQGKTIYRILFNWLVKDKSALISGKVVDIAGGAAASYYHYLPKDIEIIKTNCFPGPGIDQVVDFERVLPFDTNSVDTILFFNALYIIKEPEIVIREMYRILKPGGSLLIASPFIAAEMREPHDYQRLTYEGIEAVITKIGFSSYEIIRFGDRCTSCAYLLHSFFVFNIIRMVVYACALVGDYCIPRKMKNTYPAPLGYFCVAKK